MLMILLLVKVNMLLCSSKLVKNCFLMKKVLLLYALIKAYHDSWVAAERAEKMLFVIVFFRCYFRLM